MKVGDLIKFRQIYPSCDLNRRYAIYLGEDFIRRGDGEIIQNHKVLIVGNINPTTIDCTILKYMEAVNRAS